MRKPDVSHEGIVAFLRQGGREDSPALSGQQHTSRPNSWTLVETRDGQALGQWYAEAAAERRLEILEQLDPERFATLSQSRREWLRLRDRENEGLAQEWGIRSGQLTPTPTPAAYQSFMNEASVEFRAEGFPRNPDWPTTDSNKWLVYALYAHPKRDEYLVTMRDSRKNPGNPADGIVDFIVFRGNGRTREQIITDARWQQAEHLTRWLRYAPITDRNAVMAMEEADRVRARRGHAFNAAACGSGEPPQRILFEHLEAFRRAYSGHKGLYCALSDVFGPKGSRRYCQDLKHAADYAPSPDSAEDPEKLYVTDAREFLGLIEKMDDHDRRNFQTALRRFVKIALPGMFADIPEQGRRFQEILSVSMSLGKLKLALQHGTGALNSPLYAQTLDAIVDDLQAVASGHIISNSGAPDGRARHARPDRI